MMRRRIRDEERWSNEGIAIGEDIFQIRWSSCRGGFVVGRCFSFCYIWVLGELVSIVGRFSELYTCAKMSLVNDIACSKLLAYGYIGYFHEIITTRLTHSQSPKILPAPEDPPP